MNGEQDSGTVARYADELCAYLAQNRGGNDKCRRAYILDWIR